MRLGKNERAIQARLNILAGPDVMRNPINRVMQEALSHMDDDVAEIFVDLAFREAEIEYSDGVFYIPTGVWNKERR